MKAVRALKLGVTLSVLGLAVASAMAAGGVEEPARAKVAFLGVSTAPVDPALAAHLGLETGFYQTVQHVAPGSPAAKGGVEAHDILQKLDDQIIVNFAQLTALIRSKQKGDKVTVTVLRQGQAKQLEATLGEQEAATLGAPGGDVPNVVYGFDGDQLKHHRVPHKTFKFHAGVDDLEDLPESIRKHIRRYTREMDRDEDQSLEPEVSGGGASGSSSGSSVQVHTGSTITRVVKDSERGELHYSETDGNATLKAVGPDGAVLFDGPVNTDEERAEAPAEVLKWLDEMLSDNPVRPRTDQADPARPGKLKKRIRRSDRPADATDA